VDIFASIQKYSHEQVVACYDPASGLEAIIAIHDTTLGPAFGGCRMQHYTSDEEALEDALRLARTMTYKNALARLPFGGGKAVIIIRHPDVLNELKMDRTAREALMRTFGRFVESLNGRFKVAEDMNTDQQDLIYMMYETKHVIGVPEEMGGSGEGAPYTAYGVYKGMLTCVQKALRADGLFELTVVVQGIGKVGQHLLKYLLNDRAKVIVSDVNAERLQEAKEMAEDISRKTRQIVDLQVHQDPDTVYSIPCDIFSPCAIGGVLNRDTISRLKCKIVAGAANNQLETDEDGEELRRRNITYAPDYVINAGGVLCVTQEIGLDYGSNKSERDRRVREERVATIHNTLQEVIALSEGQGISTNQAAERLAKQYLNKMRAASGTFFTLNSTTICPWSAASNRKSRVT
jgi:leucine dehydrogenase